MACSALCAAVDVTCCWCGRQQQQVEEPVALHDAVLCCAAPGQPGQHQNAQHASYRPRGPLRTLPKRSSVARAPSSSRASELDDAFPACSSCLLAAAAVLLDLLMWTSDTESWWVGQVGGWVGR